MHFLNILTLIFVVLKLTGAIAWSWLWVVTPTILWVVIVALVFVGAIALFSGNSRPKRSRYDRPF